METNTNITFAINAKKKSEITDLDIKGPLERRWAIAHNVTDYTKQQTKKRSPDRSQKLPAVCCFEKNNQKTKTS